MHLTCPTTQKILTLATLDTDKESIFRSALSTEKKVVHFTL